MEHEKEDLSKKCADLLGDLEKAWRQEAQWRGEKSGIDAKIKVCCGAAGFPHMIFHTTLWRALMLRVICCDNNLCIQTRQLGPAFIYIPTLKTHSSLKIDAAKQEADIK